MHVSPAKHSYAWLSRKCNYRTDRRTHTQTDTGQSDPYVPLCFAGNTKLIAQVWWRSTQRFSLYGVHKLISIYVHYDLDLWPSKSIGFILSPWLTCLPSLIKKSTTVKSLLCSQAYFHRCPLWPWPLTSKINRVHPLITVNMFAKSDKEIHNG